MTASFGTIADARHPKVQGLCRTQTLTVCSIKPPWIKALVAVTGPTAVPGRGQWLISLRRGGDSYTPAMTRLLLSCGEPSGDTYGGALVHEIGKLGETPEVFGLGGDRLAEQGASLIAHVRDLAVVGLWEVVSHLPRFRRIFREILAEVDRCRPDAAVLVDYPDFNLRLARELKARQVPVVYYVSPQVWAWRRRRIKAIRQTVARMLVIFPFEEAFYRQSGVPVTFVGHPLVDLVRPAPDRGAFLKASGLDPNRPLLAILPGSRRQEVAHNLPPLLGAIRLLAERKPDLQFALPLAPSLPGEVFRQALAGLPVRCLEGQAHQLLGACDAAVVASGTATVEAALLGTPLVVVYRLSGLTYRLGRRFVKVPHYAMVNLIAGRRVAPEIIQREFTAERVAEEALSLLGDPARRLRMKQDLAEVRQKLGGGGASARAARALLEVLGLRPPGPERLGS